MTGRYQISLREGGDECEVIIITYRDHYYQYVKVIC